MMKSVLLHPVRLSVLLFCAALFLGTAMPVAHAQAASSTATLRVTQLAYRSLGDDNYLDTADIFVDSSLIAEDVLYSLTTDYVNLPSGTHSVTFVLTGETEQDGRTVEITLTAGHAYHLVAYGDFAAGDNSLTFVPIDETMLTADKGVDTGGSAMIMVHLLDEVPALDIYFGAELVIEGLAFGNAAATALPLAATTLRITLAGAADAVLIETNLADVGFAYLPYTVVTSVGMGSLEYAPLMRFTSALPIGDWLAAVGAVDAGFIYMAEAVELAGLHDTLNGGGPFTVFAPVDRSFEYREVPALAENVSAYIVPGRFSPFTLLQQERLNPLEGAPLVFNFGQTESGLWEINGSAEIWNDFQLANGVVYRISGLLNTGG